MDPSRTGTQRPPSPGLPALFSELRDDFASLFQATTALLRQELRENATNVGDALKKTAIGVGVLCMGMLFVLIAINLLAISLLAPETLSVLDAAWICTAVTAALLSIAGIILVKRNAKEVSAEELIPDKTLRTLEEHGEWLLSKTENATK